MKNINYVCSECGAISSKWQGKCSECSAWNTMIETVVRSKSHTSKLKPLSERGKPESVLDIDFKSYQRILTGDSETDHVLGGGIVSDSVVLLAGEPGIGKSTLAMQIASRISENLKVLYISGEESGNQIKMRASRLGVKSENLFVYQESDVADILNVISSQKPDLVIVDSIQTVYSPEIPSAPGGVSQVQNCTMQLLDLAKSSNIPMILIGHVTKEGAIAGPKVLEHMVDVVLYLEGDRYHDLRMLRGIKNRYGSSGEVGIFEMRENGLHQLKDPSKLLLKERIDDPGSVITVAVEGSRPFLIEVQGLVSACGFGYPKRVASGLDFNRLNLLVAVLTKKAGLNLSNQDVYVNLVGGFRISEPALDLSVALAIASSFLNKKMSKDLVVLGEIGLTGELRQTNLLQRRLKEVEKLDFKEVLIPAHGFGDREISGTKLKIIKARTLKEAINLVLK